MTYSSLQFDYLWNEWVFTFPYSLSLQLPNPVACCFASIFSTGRKEIDSSSGLLEEGILCWSAAMDGPPLSLFTTHPLPPPHTSLFRSWLSQGFKHIFAILGQEKYMGVEGERITGILSKQHIHHVAPAILFLRPRIFSRIFLPLSYDVLKMKTFNFKLLWHCHQHPK